MLAYGVNFVSSSVLPNHIGTQITAFLLHSLAPKLPPAAAGDKSEQQKR